MSAANSTFYGKLVELGVYPNTRNLAAYVDAFLGDTRFDGRTVLDIGGGAGLFTFVAARRGARRAVLLEPELSGSTRGHTEQFRARSEALGLSDRTQLAAATIQSYDPAELRFDVALSSSSINHWDEPACIAAHRSPKARATYVAILRRLHDMMNPGGDLVISDGARRNLFGDLGLRNLSQRSIEWHKHQSPHFWASLCEEAGFERPLISWTTYNTLGRLGARIMNNPLAAYLTLSTFRYSMVRSA